MTTINTIVLYPRPHADTTTAVFLLRQYGDLLYPGIRDAQIAFWTTLPEGKTAESLLHEGVLLVDIGGGALDHHNTTAATATGLVARHLGIEKNPEIQKLLRWTERDEVNGMGTASQDMLDRAFGLSGLLMSLHRTHLDAPQKVLDAVFPLLDAHLAQENRRTYHLPAEWERAVESGTAHVYKMPQRGRTLTVVDIHTASMDMAGFLRTHKKIKADVVVQLLPSGHINIITKQDSQVDLSDVIRILRIEEARKKGISPAEIGAEQLAAPGRIPHIPEWFYDTVASTVQNGGVIPESVAPTRLSPQDVVNALFIGLDEKILEKHCPPKGCRGTDCYFFEYDLGRCKDRKKQ